MTTKPLCRETIVLDGVKRECTFYAEHVVKGKPHRCALPAPLKGERRAMPWHEWPAVLPRHAEG